MLANWNLLGSVGDLYCFSNTHSMLVRLGMDEVLKVPYKSCCFWARSARGQIQGGAKIGRRGSPLNLVILADSRIANYIVLRAQKPKAPVTYCDHGLSVVFLSVHRPFDNLHFQLFSSPEPKAQVSYCHSAPSVVRPSSSVCKLSHFQLLLQNRLIDFDETW